MTVLIEDSSFFTCMQQRISRKYMLLDEETELFWMACKQKISLSDRLRVHGCYQPG